MKFHGRNGRVTGLDCVEGDTRRQSDGRVEFIPRQDTGFGLKAELVLLAPGYIATGFDRIAEDSHLEHDPLASVKTDEDHMTSIPGVFIAGDMRTGPSLVARAIADGISAAREIRETCAG